jgi:myo-inositol-1(or 4)-monophosphatase
MNRTFQRRALQTAVAAARAAGALMCRNLTAHKIVNEAARHDIKLELDVRCQRLIERRLRQAFPDIPILGEEGMVGDPDAPLRWVVDPIDGTVNFAYDVPHACTCIALQVRDSASLPTGFRSVVGVTYDPFLDEMFTATSDGPARLNGRVIRVSARARLAEALVATGFSKSRPNMRFAVPYASELAVRSRKIRMMGSAGTMLAYVAAGRFDAYVELSISIWDFAAGSLLVERAGGEFWCEPGLERGTWRMIADNGKLRKKLPALPRLPRR